jgi:hypothetical protein
VEIIVIYKMDVVYAMMDFIILEIALFVKLVAIIKYLMDLNVTVQLVLLEIH